LLVNMEVLLAANSRTRTVEALAHHGNGPPPRENGPLAARKWDGVSADR
jgi:hypothetical protein